MQSYHFGHFKGCFDLIGMRWQANNANTHIAHGLSMVAFELVMSQDKLSKYANQSISFNFANTQRANNFEMHAAR